MSATQVLTELGGELAYTTVMTTLARLHAKGVLTRQMSGRAYVYAVAGDPRNVEASLAAHRMRRVLDSRQDRAGVLARFVADLSPEDEQVLANLLAGRSGRGEK
jgi:predicted transcriptional regulator